MKTLETIQKTMHVFEILTKIAYVFSVLGAVFCAVGALLTLVGQSGGQVIGLFGESITYEIDQTGADGVMAALLSDTVFLTTDAILLSFARRYFRMEQADGTPFTETGADYLKKLGICCIWMPIVSMVAVAVILAILGAEADSNFSNLPSVGTGILLILTSLVFRYGAALEQQAGITHGAP